MAHLASSETRRFNADPLETVDYHLDVDYVGDGIRHHRLDVLRPKISDGPLPVYIYFHGGGWTSGDKEPLTKYCATQAADGMLVINANYRMATRFHLTDMLADANAVLDWVTRNAQEFGGDSTRIILGGDSAGGHLAALLAATTHDTRLAAHYRLTPAVAPSNLRGLVQHCSLADFSVMFERNFVLSLNFLRMLLPGRGRGASLETAARFVSPIEWLDRGFPPVFITTSERDYFYGANLNFIRALKKRSIPVDSLIFGRGTSNPRHTWQQDAGHPQSAEVYQRLGAFVRTVAGHPAARPGATPGLPAVQPVLQRVLEPVLQPTLQPA